MKRLRGQVMGPTRASAVKVPKGTDHNTAVSRNLLSTSTSEYSFLPAISSMSLSPSASVSNGSETTAKRRRTSNADMSRGSVEAHNHSSNHTGSANIPKRGARACTACRKGKNRCEGEVRFVFILAIRTVCSLVRPPVRPGFFCLGSMSSLPTQWNSLCV